MRTTTSPLVRKERPQIRGGSAVAVGVEEACMCGSAAELELEMTFDGSLVVVDGMNTGAGGRLMSMCISQVSPALERHAQVNSPAKSSSDLLRRRILNTSKRMATMV